MVITKIRLSFQINKNIGVFLINFMKVKANSLSKTTLESMDVGDSITFVLPGYDKVLAARVSITLYSKTTGAEFKTSENPEQNTELTVTRTR